MEPEWKNYDFATVNLRTGDKYRVKIPDSQSNGEFSCDKLPIVNIGGIRYIDYPAKSSQPYQDTGISIYNYIKEVKLTQAADTDGGWAARDRVIYTTDLVYARRYALNITLSFNDEFKFVIDSVNGVAEYVLSQDSGGLLSTVQNNSSTCIATGINNFVSVEMSVNDVNRIYTAFFLTVNRKTTVWSNYNFDPVSLYFDDAYSVKIPQTNSNVNFTANYPIVDNYIVIPSAVSTSLTLTQAETSTHTSQSDTLTFSRLSAARYPTLTRTLDDSIQLMGVTSATSDPDYTSVLSDNQITCDAVGQTTVTVTLPVNEVNVITSTFELIVIPKTTVWSNYNFDPVSLYFDDAYSVKIPQTNSNVNFTANYPIVDNYIVIPSAVSTSLTLTQAETSTHTSQSDTLTFSRLSAARYPTLTRTLDDSIQLMGVTSATSDPDYTSVLSDNQITCDAVGQTTVTVTLPVNAVNVITSTFQLNITRLTPTVRFTMVRGKLQVPLVTTVPSGLVYTATYTQSGQVVSQPTISGPHLLTVTTTETPIYSASTQTFNFMFRLTERVGSKAKLLRFMGFNYPYRG